MSDINVSMSNSYHMHYALALTSRENIQGQDSVCLILCICVFVPRVPCIPTFQHVALILIKRLPPMNELCVEMTVEVPKILEILVCSATVIIDNQIHTGSEAIRS